MARTQVDTVTGLAPAAPVGLSANTTDESVYDVFVGNQGEGTMFVTLDWTASDFEEVFMPPHSHRDRVVLEPGVIIPLDSLEIVQVVARRGTGTGTSNITATGRKTRLSAASLNNDYLVVGSGLRATT